MTSLELIRLCQAVEEIAPTSPVIAQELAASVRAYLRAQGRTAPAPKGFHHITLELTDDTFATLEQLTHTPVECVDVPAVLRHLACSAADGVRRPGSWERGWVEQAFAEVNE